MLFIRDLIVFGLTKEYTWLQVDRSVHQLVFVFSISAVVILYQTYAL